MERKLGLSSRNENSRNMLVPDMHVSKLDEMYEQFCKNVETVKEKFHIAEQLDNVHEEKAVKESVTDCVFGKCTGLLYALSWNLCDGTNV